MRSADEIKQIVLDLYSEAYPAADEIRLITEDFDHQAYRIIRTDDAVTTIDRKYIDDYIDNWHSAKAKAKIIEALGDFTR